MPLSIFLVQNRFGPGPKMIFSQLRFTFNHPKKKTQIDFGPNEGLGH